MKLKACLAVSALLSLSACGHLKSKHKDVVQTPLPNEVKSIERPPLVVTEDEELVLSDAETAAAEVIPEPPINKPPMDIFDRLRQGFRLQEFSSEHITKYERWNATHPTYLNNLFVRATPFLFHIVEEIDKRGLPMELALLPAIESAYKPEAVSRSKAGGLWQFIPSTGRYFGLRQDWWYDGRRDALASTTAALDYLSQLNKMFDGDWFLTLAAYNAGPGTVTKAIKRNKASNRGTKYTDLRLRSETQRYVPKLIALKNIISNPEKYKVKLPFIASQPYFEIVNLNGQIDLKKFATETNLDLAMLRHLNAGFKRWATSPNGPNRLLVPIGDGNVIAKAQAAVKNTLPVSYQNHRISQGDTLSGIADRYGVSVAALQKSNNLRSSRIRAGKDLRIPVPGGADVASASYASENEVLHRVKRGDTLWSIARRYKVRLQELLAWNNISPNQILHLNQSLKVITRALN